MSIGKLVNLPTQAWRLGKTLAYLKRTSAPLGVIAEYGTDRLLRRHVSGTHVARQREFQASLSSLRLSSDWFTPSVHYWLATFAACGIRQDAPIRALEIGSWEGLSAVFMLQTFPNLSLTCVDAWQGSDEHFDRERVRRSEGYFDHNISSFGDRVLKFKGTSYAFFDSPVAQTDYDIIYVDGSHHADDVVIDAIKGFERLKVGGLMIFDDYLWQHYPRASDNPAGGVHAFLRMKRGSYKILRAYYQIIIQKTKSQERDIDSSAAGASAQ